MTTEETTIRRSPLDDLDPLALIRVARRLDDPPTDDDELSPVELVEIARGNRPMPNNRKDLS